MEFTGKIQNITKDWNTNQNIVTLSVNEQAAIAGLNDLVECEKLNIRATKYRKSRSLNANKMLWACLGEIAAELQADKWEIYLQMLQRYGKYTYICVKPNMVEAVKNQWRESEEIGPIKINGSDAVQMLCYFGSSRMNSKEFSVLLNGVVSEMKEIGLTPPPSEDMKRALEEWERRINEKHNTAE